MVNEDEIKPQLLILKEYYDKKGYLTLSDIDELFKGRDEDFIDEVIVYLIDNGYEVNTDDESMQNLDMEEIDSELDDLNDDDFLTEEESEIKISDFDSNDNSSFQTDDLVRLYLHEIGQVDLLTINQELELARGVQNGLMAQEKLDQAEKNGKVLPPEEVAELQRLIKIGYRDQNTLVESNLRLVVSIARHYTNRGLELLDLIQEGSQGLCKAVVKYDPTRGNKFSTYAHWWIRQGIARAISDKGRTVRIPVHMHECITHLSKVRRKLTQELHRDPTQEELAKEMNMSVEDIIKLQRYSQDSISFDATIGDDDDSTLIDLVADESTLNPLEYTEKSIYSEEMDDILQTLTPREEMVIRLRFGIGVDRVHTLEEVGKIMDLTRERVRQIETKAMDRLRQYQRLSRLKQHMTL